MLDDRRTALYFDGDLLLSGGSDRKVRVQLNDQKRLSQVGSSRLTALRDGATRMPLSKRALWLQNMHLD